MSLPTCPGCGQLVDVGYDGPKVAIRPLPWPGATWHAGCAVSGFQQEQEAGAPRRLAILWAATVALLTAAGALLLWPPMPWKLAAVVPGLPGLLCLLVATVGRRDAERRATGG